MIVFFERIAVMTNEEKLWFQKLTEDREDSARTLEKRSMKGVRTSVVDKYTDQAHFIYELLQNADDANATSVRFALCNKGLVFAHNGTRRFTVTDPDNEDEDSINGTLGDINSITSIANSNKNDDKNKIGKFGVGFKAVFQYTETPKIYDPEIAFRIERFIVPKLIKEDCEARKSDETLFLFPFNHHEKTAEEAYEDIASKLKSLVFPILFLPKLQKIRFDIDGFKGTYSKDIKETRYFKDITAERIHLIQNSGEEKTVEELWLFSRKEDGNVYSVGFALDKNGKLKPIDKPAFCFFPTKEDTKLHFIVHAPFLLNDSREGILAGEEHNKKMINLLARLAGDALVCLKEIAVETKTMIINDDILDIVPYDDEIFTEIGNRDRISFKPFYDEIKERFESEDIIPSADGYVYGKDAYWPYFTVISEIFSDEQLSELTFNPDARWVFSSLPRQSLHSVRDTKSDYIDDIVNACIYDDDLLDGNYAAGTKRINPEFIESQSIEWLHKFYSWLNKATERSEKSKILPVFLNSDSKAVEAFDSNNMPKIFISAEASDNFSTIHPDLLKNEETVAFFKKIGIKEPSLKDEIYNHILPKYEYDYDIDEDNDFIKMFTYYKQCPKEELKSYINLVKDCEIIYFKCANDDEIYRGIAETIYFPEENLLKYFEPQEEARFLDYDAYKDVIDEKDWDLFIEFLEELGVSRTVRIIDVEYSHTQATVLGLPNDYFTGDKKWIEKQIDGCEEILEAIVKEQSLEYSIALWNQLLFVIDTDTLHVSYSFNTALDRILKGNYYRNDKTKSFIEIKHLKSFKWLMGKDGEFHSGDEMSTDELASEYEINSDNAKELIRFLGIHESHDDADIERIKRISELTDEEKKALFFAKKLKALGFENEEDAQRAAQLLRAEKQKKEEKRLEEEAEKGNKQLERINRITTDVSKRANEFVEKGENVAQSGNETKETVKKPLINTDFDDEADEDDYTPKIEKFEKRKEKAEEKAAAEVGKIAYEEDLETRISGAEKYSYEWFTSLLELEAIRSGENNMNSREVSISFAKVEREAGTQRTLILKHPSRHIPQFMEELADIPLVLQTENEKKTVAIEVINIKSYTLRVKLKANAELDNFDLSAVREATINAQNPAFLLEALRKEFNALDFEPDYNMRDNLPENIEFVFGPPGTGKTTHLAKNVILPLMNGKEKPRILVLTPTNKASDILASRIMEVSEDSSYEEWLTRFGGTGDEAIEQSPIFRDKTFDIQSLEKSCVITTIARFPYDSFMPFGKWLFIKDLKWDYIIIDEASMVPIANIVYPLYKKTPKKFIIAGDPFQIEPIVAVDTWKDESIYTLVKLNSFVNPTTVPHDYKVELLTTQYRSIPAVGTVFSQFTYGGILKHFRDEDSQRPLNIDAGFDINTLNIIKFPVSKYESIYRPKRLQGKTPYHIYSALFSCEFANYLANLISKSNPEEIFRIGIISTYRAQADLIDKLLASMKLPEKVDIQVGTIHGFQGDECDMIIAVFNPPPKIGDSSQTFLNKTNIINVSISRAKDYMFIIMPDDDTENINNLRLVKRVEKLFKNSGVCCEIESHEVEEIMFGDENYLENNSFSTSHQAVNVYSLPEKYYEIRSEDTAVDVQIHKSNKPGSGEATVAPAKKYIYSRTYGKGEVVMRRRDAVGRALDIKFDSLDAVKTFYGEKAFLSGELSWIE